MKKTFKHKRIKFTDRIRRAIFSLFRNEIMEIVTPYINTHSFYQTKTLDFVGLHSEFQPIHGAHLSISEQIEFAKRELVQKAVDFVVTESSYNHGIHTQKDVKLTLFIGKIQ